MLPEPAPKLVTVVAPADKLPVVVMLPEPAAKLVTVALPADKLPVVVMLPEPAPKLVTVVAPAVKLLVILAVPLTSKVNPGVGVPIPTFALVIRIRSTPAVVNARLLTAGRNVPLNKSFEKVYAGRAAVPFDEARIIPPVKLPGTDKPPPAVVILPTDKLPETFAVPFTSRVNPGVVVAMPTFPFDRIRTRSTPAVVSAKLLALGRKVPLDKSFEKVYTGTAAVPFDEARIIAPVRLPGTENPPPAVVILPTDKLPETFAVPLTSKAKPGVVVPIPTFPLGRILIRSTPAVVNARLLALGRDIPLVTSVVNAYGGAATVPCPRKFDVVTVFTTFKLDPLNVRFELASN
jgi:hypothetical protein